MYISSKTIKTGVLKLIAFFKPFKQKENGYF